jgi:hypothetical protein
LGKKEKNMIPQIKIVSESSVKMVIYTRSICGVEFENDDFIIHTTGGKISLNKYKSCEIQYLSSAINRGFIYDGTTGNTDKLRLFFLNDLA